MLNSSCSLGTCVHLDLDIVDSYLSNISQVLSNGGKWVVQYADMTKPAAPARQGFSDNGPSSMRALVAKHDYEIKDEDLSSFAHSSVFLATR